MFKSLNTGNIKVCICEKKALNAFTFLCVEKDGEFVSTTNQGIFWGVGENRHKGYCYCQVHKPSSIEIVLLVLCFHFSSLKKSTQCLSINAGGPGLTEKCREAGREKQKQLDAKTLCSFKLFDFLHESDNKEFFILLSRDRNYLRAA